MKRIIYLLVLLLCFAGCKKEEVKTRVKVARTSFENKTKLQSTLYIIYSQKTYVTFDDIATSYGDKRFEIINREGETIIDTTLTVSGDKHYYIYQAVATDKPVLLTELPPPPPPAPENPLDDVTTAAPVGFVQLRIRNQAQVALPFENLDVVVHAVGFDPVLNEEITMVAGTFSLNGFDYNRELFQFQRPAGYGSYFIFTFINHNTGEEIKDSSGNVFRDPYGSYLTKSTLNTYAIEIGYYETTDPGESKIAILRNGKYYMVYSDLKFQK